MKGQLRIETCFAFVVIDDDGTEGVIGANMDDTWVPLMGADEERVDSLRPLAQLISTAVGKEVTLLRFGGREELEVIRPEESSAPGGA